MPSRPCSGRGAFGSVVSHFGPPTAASNTASAAFAASSVAWLIGGITEESLLQSVDMAVKMEELGDFGELVPDYEVGNVSSTVIRIIQSYTRIIDDKVWRKQG